MQEQTLQGYRISPLQHRLWRLSRKQSDGGYIVRAVVRADRALDPDRLKEALTAVIGGCDALRTEFRVLPGVSVPVQVIHETPRFEFHDGVQLPRINGMNGASGDLRQTVSSDPPIFHCCLDSTRAEFVLTVPALCADARSMYLIVRELCRVYQGHATPGETAAERLQYPDIAEWLNGLQESSDTLQGRQHWAEELADSLDFLPVCDIGSAQFSPAGLSITLPDNGETVLDVSGQDQRQVPAILLTVWASVVERFGYQSRCLAICGDGRCEDALKEAIGPLTRHLPVKTQFTKHNSVREASETAARLMREAAEWQDYFGWEWLEKATGLSSGLRYVPVSFDFMEIGSSGDEPAGMNFSITAIDAFSDRFDFQLNCQKLGSKVHWRLYWDQLKHSRTEAETLGKSFAVALRDAIDHPEKPLYELELVDGEQRNRLLDGYSAAVEFEKCLLIHELFESQRQRTPDAIAVRFEEENLSYSELDRLATRVATHLSSRGIQAESLVGICMERSLEIVAAILGVLKAGAAYVPLDPAYPKHRLQFMIQDSRMELLITGAGRPSEIDNLGCPHASIESICEVQEQSTKLVRAAADNAAYVIYTSGSTGTPKGTVVTHRAIANHMAWMSREFNLTAKDSVLQKTAFSFDASVWEFYAPLISGGRLVMARPGGQQERDYLLECICANRITMLQLVPSQLEMLVMDDELSRCTSLRMVFCGGESLSMKLVKRFYKLLPAATLYNLYGPTEATIDATFARCDPELGDDSAPIGKPIANMRAYVLDPRLRLVPTTIQGELCLAGTGLARGYLQRPDLTAEKFVPDPFGPKRGGRMYRTGDQVTWSVDGNLEFFGRSDEQVKVRGHRIEPGEIEKTLSANDAITNAAVAVREYGPGDKRVIAYVVGKKGAADLVAGELREYLKARLPEYMVPSAFVMLEKMPLLPNGKIARNELPPPDEGQEHKNYMPPQNAEEEILCGIFADLLKRQPVGRDEDFFETGGHSLLATQLVSRVRKIFEIDLPLRTLFDGPRPSDLARRIRDAVDAREQPRPPVVHIDRSRDLPLSYAQQRLWLIEQLQPSGAAYNMSSVLRLRGELNSVAFRRALSMLILRHETLRTSFHVHDGVPVQRIMRDPELDIEEIDLTMMNSDEREAGAAELVRRFANQPFDLIDGPLLRVGIVRMDACEHILLITVHHIISDGWSTAIMIRELAHLYSAYARGQEPSLPALSIQYGDFSAWQRNWLQGEVLQQQLEYWSTKLADLPVLELPTDRPRPAEKTYHGCAADLEFPAGMTGRLRALSHREGVTLFMILLAIFHLMLSKRSEQTDIAIGTGIANRDMLELEGLIGFFVNTLVLRLDSAGCMTFRELLARARQTVLEAFRHREIPFERLVQELRPNRDPSRTPLFQAMFVFQNMPPEKIELPGLQVVAMPQQLLPVRSDLDMYLVNGDVLRGALVYDPELFDAGTVAEMIHDLKSMAGNIADNPDVPLSDLASKHLTAASD